MKSLMKKIDIFCYKHPRFGIRNLMLYVVVGAAIVWLFNLFTMYSSVNILSYLYFSPYLILHGQILIQLKGKLFQQQTEDCLGSSGHGTSGRADMTAASDMVAFYFYYFIGRTLEQQWGPGKFTIYFFTGVVLTIVYGFVIYFATGADLLLSYGYPVSAHYIYLSMFFTFATLYPDMQVLLFFIIPIKMKWLALVDAAFFVYSVVTSPFPINLLPIIPERGSADAAGAESEDLYPAL